jgi:inosine-uridine nucleoside N-ribohydrolase
LEEISSVKKKVIIDCDVGVDDALALILAFHSPELEVKAVTGVNGNVPLDLVFTNIQKVLSLIRPQNKPIIAKGADRPLRGDSVHAFSVHGETGLGRSKIKLKPGQRRWRLSSSHARELIPALARQFPDEVTLIAVAPLTSLALALEKDPQGMRKLREVVVMGGAVRTGGNVTPHAEFNIYVDPHAAKIIFDSGLPITLVPLDVTHQVFLTPQVMEERVKPVNNSLSKFLIEATDYDLATQRFWGRSERFHLHDPLAVGYVIDPELLEKERVRVHVETQQGEYFGKTTETSARGKDIDVCFGVDSERFLQLFLSRLGKT